LVEIKDQFKLFGSINQITQGLDEIENATSAFIHKYDDQKFLWEEHLDVSFKTFLDSGSSFEEIFSKKIEATRTGSDEDDLRIEGEMLCFHSMEEKIMGNVVTRFPSLEVFDEKIQFLLGVKKSISEMKQSVDIGWLRVNSLPLIKELEKTIELWINTHTNFLLNNTTQQIRNIKQFISDVTEGIKVVPKGNESPAERSALMSVMTHLRDVKMIKDKTLDMVEPMKQAIMLMKKHQVKMEEDFLVVLETNKSSLKDVAEKALGPVKESILPLQNSEAENIKGRLARFGVVVQEFRIKFCNNCPFHVTETNPKLLTMLTIKSLTSTTKPVLSKMKLKNSTTLSLFSICNALTTNNLRTARMNLSP